MGGFTSPSPIGSVRVGRLDRNSVTVFVSGEQDQSNVASLHSALTLASAMADRVVVDLAAATFVSAALVGAVASAEASLHRRGAGLTVCSPSPMARRVFEMTSLEGLIDERCLTPSPAAAAWRPAAARSCAPRSRRPVDLVPVAAVAGAAN